MTTICIQIQVNSEKNNSSNETNNGELDRILITGSVWFFNLLNNHELSASTHTHTRAHARAQCGCRRETNTGLTSRSNNPRNHKTNDQTSPLTPKTAPPLTPQRAPPPPAISSVLLQTDICSTAMTISPTVQSGTRSQIESSSRCRLLPLLVEDHVTSLLWKHASS